MTADIAGRYGGHPHGHGDHHQVLRQRDEAERNVARAADAGANIEEVHHQRAFTMLAAQNVEIELVLQTRGKSHVEQVLDQLRTAGMEAALM